MMTCLFHWQIIRQGVNVQVDMIDDDLLVPMAGYQTGGEEDQLLSLEKLRASPELWPEQSESSFSVSLFLVVKSESMAEKVDSMSCTKPRFENM